MRFLNEKANFWIDSLKRKYPNALITPERVIEIIKAICYEYEIKISALRNDEIDRIYLTGEQLDNIMKSVDAQIDYWDTIKEDEDLKPEEARELEILMEVLALMVKYNIKWEKMKDGVFKTNIKGQDIYRLIVD